MRLIGLFATTPRLRCGVSASIPGVGFVVVETVGGCLTFSVIPVSEKIISCLTFLPNKHAGFFQTLRRSPHQQNQFCIDCISILALS